MSVIKDKDFGEITVRRSHLAKYVRIKISPNGQIVASLPKRAPLKLAQQLIDKSRNELKKLVGEHNNKRIAYSDGDLIGKSHRLAVTFDSITKPKHRIAAQIATVTLPNELDINDDDSQQAIRDALRAVLTKEAKSYLPRRVGYLAGQYGFDIKTVRFNNAKTRWGSCSSSGSINLNIALMQLPHELIDYVIIHELCHTRHMDHSQAFWSLLASFSPDYKKLRSQLRAYNPYL